jgi:hypothetical protein
MSCCLPPQLMDLFCLRLLGCRRCDLRDRWDRSNGLGRGPTYRCSRGIAQVRLVDAPVSCPDKTQLSLVFHGLDAVQSKLLRVLLCEFEELGHRGLVLGIDFLFHMAGQSLVHGAGAVGMVGLVDAASSCCETVVQDALSLQLGSGRHNPVL